MSGVAPVPVFAPAVPKASSPLEGILEVCRELIVRFYFGMPLRASLPAWRALLELSGALGCWGHGRARASSVWDCPMALLSPSVTSVLWPAAIWAMKRSLGWAVWLWSGFLHPALALRALCPIPALPAPTHCSCFEQTSPRPMERFCLWEGCWWKPGQAWKAPWGLVWVWLWQFGARRRVGGAALHFRERIAGWIAASSQPGVLDPSGNSGRTGAQRVLL